MGKVNRFMPTEEISCIGEFEGGMLFWTYSESEVMDRSCLTIYFVRNISKIENPHLKKYAEEMIQKQTMFHLVSDAKLNDSALSGVFKTMEFEDPHYAQLAYYVEQARNEVHYDLKEE